MDHIEELLKQDQVILKLNKIAKEIKDESLTLAKKEEKLRKLLQKVELPENFQLHLNPKFLNKLE